MDNTFEKQKSRRWIYVVIGVIILLCLGLIYAWSVFRVPLESEFGWTRSETSIAFSISMIMFCLGGLVSGIVTDTYGTKFTLIFCAIFLAIGFIAASRITSLLGIYLTYGVFAGFGVGLGYNSCIGTCVKWFPDKQGLVSGLSMFGFGGGAMLLGTLAASMIISLGWRFTFLLIGVGFAVIVFIGALILHPVTDSFLNQFSSNSRNHISTVEEIDWKQMLRRKNWWLYFTFAVFLTSAGLAIFNISTIYAGTFVSGNLTQAAVIAGVVSIANGIGRIVFGQMFDMAGYKFTMFGVCTAFVLAALILIVAETTKVLSILIVGFFIIGFGYGGIATCNSAFTAHFFGIKNYSLNFSLATCNIIPASFIGPMCDNGTYTMTFIAILLLGSIGFVATLLIRKPKGGVA